MRSISPHIAWLAAHRTVFTDVFAYRDGRWVAINAQETPVATPRFAYCASAASQGTCAGC